MELHHVVLGDIILIAPPKTRRQPERHEPIGTCELHYNRIIIGGFDFHRNTVDLAPNRWAVFVAFIKAEVIIESKRGSGIRMSVRPFDPLAEMQRQDTAILIKFPCFRKTGFQTRGIKFPSDERRIPGCHLPRSQIRMCMEPVPRAAIGTGTFIAIEIRLGDERVFWEPFRERGEFVFSNELCPHRCLFRLNSTRKIGGIL